MTETKRACPADDAAGQAMETGTVCETASNSIPYNITQDGRGQVPIYDLLLSGSENAISRAALMEATGLSERALRLAIADERRAGHIILSDCAGGGYFRPGDSREVIRFIRSMRHRAKQTAEIANATERALMDEAGQSNFTGWWKDECEAD